MKKKYTPKPGDIIWLDMDPQAGHEISKRRPAVVVSGKAALELIPGLATVCPITSTDNGFPTHVPLDSESRDTTGFVVCEQFKSLDITARNAEYKDHVSGAVLTEIRNIIKSTLSDDEEEDE